MGLTKKIFNENKIPIKNKVYFVNKFLNQYLDDEKFRDGIYYL